MNLVTLIGRLGTDPKVSYTPSGKSVCNLRIATTERFNGKSETTWHNVVAWGSIADACGKYLEKGREISIQGRIDNRFYQDKEGKKCFTSSIVARSVEFLGSKNGTSNLATLSVEDTNSKAEIPSDMEDEEMQSLLDDVVHR